MCVRACLFFLFRVWCLFFVGVWQVLIRRLGEGVASRAFEFFRRSFALLARNCRAIRAEFSHTRYCSNFGMIGSPVMTSSARVGRSGGRIVRILSKYYEHVRSKKLVLSHGCSHGVPSCPRFGL